MFTHLHEFDAAQNHHAGPGPIRHRRIRTVAIAAVWALTVAGLTSVSVGSDTAAAVSVGSSSNGSSAETGSERELIPDLSNATTNTFLEPDGTHSLEAYTTPVNYEDAPGDWQPIDNTLVDAPGSTYALENAGNEFKVLIPEDPSVTPVRFAQDGAWVTMRLHGADDVAAEADGTAATFEDVANTDGVTYEVVNTGVKESIHLDTAPDPSQAPLVYTYTVESSAGLTPVLTDEGGIEFRNNGGVAEFAMPAGLMWDSNPTDPALSEKVTFALVAVGNSWELSVTPDMEWLTDPSRAYPVIIDPSLTMPTPLRDCWMGNSSPTASHCGSNSQYIKAGREDSAHRFRGLIDFDVSAIPANATVSTATASLYLSAAQSLNGLYADYAFYRAGKLFDSSATWNTSGAAGAWNPEGGAPGATAYGTKNLNGAGDGWKNFTGLDPVIQGWVNGTMAHTGLVLKQTDEVTNNMIAFYSSSTSFTANQNKWPYLTVNYTGAPAFVPGSLNFAPCTSDCDPAWRFTSTLTPTLKALATDLDGGSLNYTFQIRPSETSSVIASGSTSAVQGNVAAWTVPSGYLQNETVYEFRASASDGSTTVWTDWSMMGVDIDEAPAPASEVQVSPCQVDCLTLISTSLRPVLSATIADPDTAVLEADFEVRGANTTTVLTSGTVAGADGSRAYFSVPADKLADDSGYEFRVGTRDNTGATWSSWTGFTVDVPDHPQEPVDMTLATCAGPCSEWTSSTATPTFQATRSDLSSDSTGLEFEVTSGQYTSSGTIADVGVLDTASWTVPSGFLGQGNYLVRVGAVTSTGTTWTAWWPFAVADSATAASFPEADGAKPESGMSGYDPNWTSDPSKDVDDSGPLTSYDDTDLALFDAMVDGDVSKASTAGVAPDVESQTYYRSVPVWQKYAPKMFFHPQEQANPLSATTFINHSELRWAHDSYCEDVSLSGSPSASWMANGSYAHQAASASPFCNHSGTVWNSTDNVRPRNDGGPDGAEGMFLDLDNSLRDGGDFTGREPVYADYVPFNHLTYWFNWGRSGLPLGLASGLSRHEADWERISLKLDNSTNAPKVLEYFHHHVSCTLPWGEVPRNKTHAKIWVALQGHGSYPAESVAEDAGFGWHDAISDGGKVWYGTKNPKLVTGADWWGYDGGWGEVGNTSDTTGPEGPSAHKALTAPAKFSSQKCIMQSQ